MNFQKYVSLGGPAATHAQLVHGQCLLVSAGKSTVKIASMVENLVTTLETAQTQTLNTDMIYAGATHCMTKKTV